MSTTTSELIAQRVLVRDMPDRSRIVATLRVDRIGGNAHPHFSATADVYDPRGTWSGAARSRNGREADAGGMMHDAILAAFPGAAPFVALHLSDYPSGTPMHAEANALYFWRERHLRYELEHYGLAYAEQRGTGPERAARILRLPVDALPHRDTTTDDEFRAFVAAQAPRWEREAADAMALLARMPDATDLRGYDNYGEPVEKRPLPAWLTGTTEDVAVNV